MISYCIFVEKIFDDEKFKLLKEFIQKKLDYSNYWVGATLCMDTSKINLFVIPLENYYLAVGEQGYKDTKKQFEKIILKRYKELELMGCKINLHLHLAMNPESCDQEKMIKESVKWMKKNGFNPEYITWGWYISDETSKKLAKKYGLKVFNTKWKFNIHDYELPRVFTPMMILQNIRNLFRRLR